MRRAISTFIILLLVVSVLTGYTFASSENDAKASNSSLVLSSILTVAVSVVLSFVTTKHELGKAKKVKLSDKRFEAYKSCIGTLEYNIAHRNAVFTKQFLDSLGANKEEMKLYASNNALQAFERYYKWVEKFYNEFSQFCQDQDSTYMIPFVNEYGEEDEIPYETEMDNIIYEYKIKKYIAEKQIDYKTVQSKTIDVINAMRKDLGNDTYAPVTFEA